MGSFKTVSAALMGSASPIVLSTMPRSSPNTGAARLAWKCFWLPCLVMTTSPASARRRSSLCTAPDPDPVSSMSSLVKKVRSGCPNKRDRTRCCVEVNRASIKLVRRGGFLPLAACPFRCESHRFTGLSFVPILGIVVPKMGTFQSGFSPRRRLHAQGVRQLLHRLWLHHNLLA